MTRVVFVLPSTGAASRCKAVLIRADQRATDRHGRESAATTYGVHRDLAGVVRSADGHVRSFWHQLARPATDVGVAVDDLAGAGAPYAVASSACNAVRLDDGNVAGRSWTRGPVSAGPGCCWGDVLDAVPQRREHQLGQYRAARRRRAGLGSGDAAVGHLGLPADRSRFLDGQRPGRRGVRPRDGTGPVTPAPTPAT